MDTGHGLAGFTAEPGGIGGLLKTRTADFRVEEVTNPPSLDERGRFTVARVTLDNWETNRFVNKLASILRIGRNRIWFAGMKDKRAITRQLFVIDAPTHKVSQVEIPDIEIEVLGRTHQKVALGDHKGNRFTVVVRGCADIDGQPLSAEEALAEVESLRSVLVARLGEGAFPNWIGPQRFGSGRAVTSLVGRHVVEGDIEAAVRAYVGHPGVAEDEEVAAFRELWRTSDDAATALEVIPERLGFERKMLKHLNEKPDDWLGAFRTLPNNLQLMTVHAVQSEVFNRIIQRRLDEGLPLSTPLPGDVVGHVDERGQLDVGHLALVGSRDVERIARNCERRRLVVTGALPGASHHRTTGTPGEVEEGVVAEMGLAGIDWQVEEIPRLSSSGTRRALVTHAEGFSVDVSPALPEDVLSNRWQAGPAEGDRWHPEGACLRFRFTLPPGAYATTLLRESMHAPLHQY